MENNYLAIILIALVIAAAVIFLLTRRSSGPEAELPPGDTGSLADDRASFQATTERSIDPVAVIPAEAIEPPIGLVQDEPPAAEPVATEPVGPPDELTRIKGLGPKAAARLNELGITRYDQLAMLAGARLEAIDAQMGNFKGRIIRDRWVEQALHLAGGDVAGFEAKFGKLGG